MHQGQSALAEVDPAPELPQIATGMTVEGRVQMMGPPGKQMLLPTPAAPVIPHGETHNKGLIGSGVTTVQQDMKAVVQIQTGGAWKGQGAIRIFQEPQGEGQLGFGVEMGTNALINLTEGLAVAVGDRHGNNCRYPKKSLTGRSKGLSRSSPTARHGMNHYQMELRRCSR